MVKSLVTAHQRVWLFSSLFWDFRACFALVNRRQVPQSAGQQRVACASVHTLPSNAYCGGTLVSLLALFPTHLTTPKILADAFYAVIYSPLPAPAQIPPTVQACKAVESIGAQIKDEEAVLLAQEAREIVESLIEDNME